MIVVAIICITFAGILFILQKKQTSSLSKTNKIKVTATFYPLAEFARNVGGDLVEVTTIVPPGAEPHDYEPTPQDIATIASSKVFIMNGNGVDAWGEKLQTDLQKKGVVIIKMSDSLNPLTHSSDPHFWLDPVLAKAMTHSIQEALGKTDPARVPVYEKNALSYETKLEELDTLYRQNLSSCKNNEIIVSHNAFSYLGKRYNFSTIPISGISPEEEPSPKKLAEIAELATQKNIHYIFFETLVNPKLAETIAKEVGAQTLVLNPLEGLGQKEVQSGKNYITVMEDNLTNLKLALVCQP